MRKKLSHSFLNILQYTLPIILFLLLFLKNPSCEGASFNKAMRTQVKQFLESSLKDIHPDSSNIDHAFIHLFDGLSLYDDHFRFGGILDYCIEKGEVEYLIYQILFLNKLLKVDLEAFIRPKKNQN